MASFATSSRIHGTLSREPAHENTSRQPPSIFPRLIDSSRWKKKEKDEPRTTLSVTRNILGLECRTHSSSGKLSERLRKQSRDESLVYVLVPFWPVKQRHITHRNGEHRWVHRSRLSCEATRADVIPKDVRSKPGRSRSGERGARARPAQRFCQAPAAIILQNVPFCDETTVPDRLRRFQLKLLRFSMSTLLCNGDDSVTGYVASYEHLYFVRCPPPIILPALVLHRTRRPSS